MKRWVLNCLLVAVFTLSALLLAVRYLLLPIATEHKADLESAISSSLGRGFQIAQMQVAWQGWEPWLEFTDVSLLNEGGDTALSLPSVRASLSWTSLTYLEPRLARLIIDQADLALRRDPVGDLWVAGLRIEQGGEGDSPALAWLLRQGDIQIQNSRLSWRDEFRQAPVIALEDVQFRVSNLVNLHRVAGSARRSDQSDSQLEFQSRFFTPLLTDRPADVSQWKGELFVSVQGVSSQRLRQWLDVPDWLTDVSGAVRVWLDFDRLSPTRLIVDPRLSALELYSPALQQGMRLNDLLGRIEWRKDHIGVQSLRLLELKATLPDATALGPLNAELRLVDDVDESRRSGRLQVTDLHVGPLLAAARFIPLPEPAAQILRQALAQGHVQAFSGEWSGDWHKPDRIRISSRFQDLGLDSLSLPDGSRLPGFSGLSGEIAGDQQSGQWGIRGKQGHLEIHELLQNSHIAFTQLASRGSWKTSGKADRRLELDWDHLDIQRGAMAANMQGNMRWGKGEMPVVDLEGKFTRVAVVDVPGLMPLALGPNALKWLNLNLRDGMASDGRWSLKGDVWHFPFANGKHGEFALSAKVDRGEVSFGSDWPAIREITGDIRFVNDAMTVQARTAKTKDSALSAVTVKIPSFSDMDWALLADGQAQGSLNDMLRYVNASPVGELLDGFLKEARASGVAKLALKLKVPLETPEKTDLKGSLSFQDNEVFLMPGVPQLSKVRGVLDFTQAGVAANGLQAFALGGNVRVDAATRAERSVQVKAEGLASAVELKRYLGVPESLRASGQTRYQATVMVKPGAGEPEISVESGLLGLGLDLPEPLIKPAGEIWPLEFRMLPTVVKNGVLLRDEFRLSLSSPKGAVLAGRLERDRTGGKTQPLRGALALGEPLTMPEQGLNVHVTLPVLDLDQWQRTQFSDAVPLSNDSLGLTTPPQRSDGPGLSPDRIFLKVDRLVLANKTFNNLNLSGLRQKDRWTLDLSADQAKGQAVWSQNVRSDAEGSLKLNFSRLTIPETPAQEGIKPAPDPTDYFEMPTLDITVEQFALGKINLGKLRLKAANEGEAPLRQWILKDLQVSNPDVVLTAKGDWRREQAGQPRRTRLDFKMDVQNAGRVLDRVGLEKLVRNGSGAMSGELQWRGPPQSFDYASMGGKLKLDIKDGQFLKAEPGVARLLGILSLQSLPRRLTLDFSDIFAAGFSFDQIYANADISNGLLQTRDFKMRGTSATVLMEGKVDLVRETQDLRAVVLPEVNAAGGTLVYSVMAANPAVGLASFLAQLLLKDPLSKVFSVDMKITGKWDDPVVEKVERSDNAQAR